MTSQTSTSRTLTVEQALELADRQLLAGKSAAAATLYRQILKVQPSHAQALHHLGIVADQSGHYAKAVQLIAKSLASQPDNLSALENLGNIHRARGDLKRAVSAYRRAIALAPTSVELQTSLGMALKQLGQLDEAETCLCEAIRLAPTADADLYLELSELLAKGGRPEEAATAIKEAIRLQPDNARFHGFLGLRRSLSGDLQAAEEALREAIRLQPETPEFHRWLGETLIKARRAAEAEPILREAVRLQPDIPKSHALLGIASFRCQQRQEARQAVCKAIELAPEIPEFHAIACGLLFESGQTTAAEAELKQLLRLAPRPGQLCQTISSSLELLGDPQIVIEACNALLSLQPGNINALARKATALDEIGDRQGYRYLVDFDRFIRRVYLKEPAGFKSVADFNAELTRQIFQNPTLTRNKGTATRFGSQTDELLVKPQGALAILEKAIAQAVCKYAQTLPQDADHPFLASKPKKWRLRVWATVLGRQGHQISHYHPGGWISGVYYVKVPDCVEAGVGQGAIEFGRSWLYALETTKPTAKLYQPQEGLMLIFPSYFWHRTVPFDSDLQRISIAFDVVPN